MIFNLHSGMVLQFWALDNLNSISSLLCYIASCIWLTLWASLEMKQKLVNFRNFNYKTIVYFNHHQVTNVHRSHKISINCIFYTLNNKLNYNFRFCISNVTWSFRLVLHNYFNKLPLFTWAFYQLVWSFLFTLSSLLLIRE